MTNFASFWGLIPDRKKVTTSIRKEKYLEYSYSNSENANLRLYQEISNSKLVGISIYDPWTGKIYIYVESQVEKELNLINYNNQSRAIKLCVLDDIYEKSEAIISNKKYDDRIMVDIEIDTEILDFLYREAHRKDVTLNQLINDTIRNELGDLK